MSRPVKNRKVCHFPQTLIFAPLDGGGGREPVFLTVDEYETIRLIDGKGFSQVQCAVYMRIARTTVQRIYESARKKLADCLVEGRPLRIEGGDFCLCDGKGTDCGQDKCFKHQYYMKYTRDKGEQIMRIAVTYQDGEIFQHFGHTEQFKIYDVQDGQIISSEVVSTNGSGHGALAGVLTALKADVLICGGIGGGAQMALAAANIRLYGGVSGNADKAVAALMAGELAWDPDARCTHHEHHGADHTCGDHGCGGGHSCGAN